MEFSSAITYVVFGILALCIVTRFAIGTAWPSIQFDRQWKNAERIMCSEMDERLDMWRISVCNGEPNSPYHVQRRIPKLENSFFQHWTWMTVMPFGDMDSAMEFLWWVSDGRFREVPEKSHRLADLLLDEIRLARASDLNTKGNNMPMNLPKYEKDPDSLPETPGHRERRLRYEHAKYLSEVASARAMAHGTSCYEELELLKSAERYHEQLSHKGELYVIPRR